MVKGGSSVLHPQMLFDFIPMTCFSAGTRVRAEWGIAATAG